MKAGGRDAVELGHLARRIAENVADDPHRGLGRVDIGVTNHELLEDVVLDGPVEQFAIDPLLLARDDEEGEYGDHRAIHRHRYRHLIARAAVEEDLHILAAVDRAPRLADVPRQARMVAVLPALHSAPGRVLQPTLPPRPAT